MYRKLMKFSALSAFVLTLVAYGCDTVNESALTGPSESPSEVLITVKTRGGYTVARETDASVGVVTAVIDRNGGALSIGNHVLSVPAGAVDSPTLFTMTKPLGTVQVDLTATRVLPNTRIPSGLANNVGSRGFNVPVKLAMSYDGVSGISNPSALKVGWMKGDGRVEVQESAVDVYGKVVVGTLNHFSAYAIVIPE